MKPLDNTIKYYPLLMHLDDTSSIKQYILPDGFHYEFYRDGDAPAWVDIHIQSGEFTSVEKGLQHFHDYFDHFIDELNKRCVFIVDDSTGEKIGTATISLSKDAEFGYHAVLDWVAIKQSHQGKHLAKPLITKMICIANTLGHDSVLLHTQTTTWLAAKLYLDLGFEALNTEETTGWSILKALTDHPKLHDFTAAPSNVIYDKRIIEIYTQLKAIYHTEDFNYSVWYKNGLHNVCVYYNGKTCEYEYFEDNNGIRLVEITKC